MDKIDTLKKSLIFRELAEPELNKLASIAHEYFYRAGEELFFQGEAADELIIISVGSVRMIKELNAQKEEDIITLGSGSFLGEMAAVQGNEERLASAFAIENTHAISLKSNELSTLCDRDNILGYHVYRAITKAFARRIHRIAADSAYYRTLAYNH
ncbi:MAG: cyclic nucleotide-binding domain-containing protein [Endozoicomonas sp. (ex Botrylloides leachii)]|nr:cyclic nucleotide-binding domain-containing protein [Endozoicomonas sp. (ex Botrylloides leachii)]